MKYAFSIVAAILFILVSMPDTYTLTDRVLGGFTLPLEKPGSQPTWFGLFIHAIVYALALHFAWKAIKA
jgi:hypothetical protein